MKRAILEPSEELADFVMCYWNLESPQAQTPEKNTIVPDGTMKLIFHYADPYLHFPENGNTIKLPRAFLVGQLTRPFVVAPTGRTGTFFVRFHPNGFFPFATFPVREIENSTLSLEKVFGPEGKEFGEAILEAESLQERVRLSEDFLLMRLKDEKTIDKIVQSTVDTILSVNGQVSVSQLSEQQKTNRRQLVRKFSKSIGLSPKQLSKTIKLQAALKKLLTKKPAKLTEVAYENEYFDQSHFIKDFREFTGLTPKEFYGDDLRMSLIFDGEE